MSRSRNEAGPFNPLADALELRIRTELDNAPDTRAVVFVTDAMVRALSETIVLNEGAAAPLRLCFTALDGLSLVGTRTCSVVAVTDQRLYQVVGSEKRVKSVEDYPLAEFATCVQGSYAVHLMGVRPNLKFMGIQDASQARLVTFFQDLLATQQRDNPAAPLASIHFYSAFRNDFGTGSRHVSLTAFADCLRLSATGGFRDIPRGEIRVLDITAQEKDPSASPWLDLATAIAAFRGLPDLKYVPTRAVLQDFAHLVPAGSSLLPFLESPGGSEPDASGGATGNVAIAAPLELANLLYAGGIEGYTIRTGPFSAGWHGDNWWLVANSEGIRVDYRSTAGTFGNPPRRTLLAYGWSELQAVVLEDAGSKANVAALAALGIMGMGFRTPYVLLTLVVPGGIEVRFLLPGRPDVAGQVSRYLQQWPKARSAVRDSWVQPPPPAGPAGMTLTEQLRDGQRMYEEGVLSEGEWQRLKARLLAGPD